MRFVDDDHGRVDLDQRMDDVGRAAPAAWRGWLGTWRRATTAGLATRCLGAAHAVGVEPALEVALDGAVALVTRPGGGWLGQVIQLAVELPQLALARRV